MFPFEPVTSGQIPPYRLPLVATTSLKDRIGGFGSRSPSQNTWTLDPPPRIRLFVIRVEPGKPSTYRAEPCVPTLPTNVLFAIRGPTSPAGTPRSIAPPSGALLSAKRLFRM